ncbi:MAG TPA: DUF2637 domain-containing protein [Trebonia sp.]
MNSPLPASGPAQRNWTRRLANVLVALVVIAVAAATFVFSYDGVHAIALLGGVSGQLARYYPGLFDAVLVIACVAAVMLRDGRWWARLWAWVVIIVLLAAIGTTDVLHAMNYTLRHRVTEGVVAAAPVAAVLLAFSLLLTLLRQSKTHPPAPAAPETIEVPALAAAAAPPIALPAAPVDTDTAPTEAVPVLAGGPVPDMAPTREDPVIANAPEPAAASQAAAPPVDEPAPPTVVVPAFAPEPPPAAPQARESHGIRYAGGGVPGMAGKQPPAAEDDGDAGDDAPQGADYWESEEAGQYAGLVYAAREDQASAEDDDDADAGDADEADADEPVAHKNLPELDDDDAPPFATAPFASVPRLNRVRSTPAPPADEEE